MKKLFLFVILCVGLISTKAFHIVGGEIEFIYLSDGLYRINLIQYFDEAQSENTGPEATITVYIFRNSDDEMVSMHDLPLLSQEDVAYTNIECAIGELATSRVIWSVDVSLDPALYAAPGGYYIAWERCCRNANIKNIVNPSGSGIKYLLEIPPLMIDGQVFVNSSPVSFQPLSDYACINQFYYTDFTGTDPDGDSLVYSLTTPLNSSSATALPVPSPKPNINVLFEPGFSVNNMIPGSPPLRISHDGFLTVTPAATGLYVFSVLVEEYRGDIKIGETRRDAQMLVVDGCMPPRPPVVDVDIPGNPAFVPETDILTYTAADAKCFDFIVSNVVPNQTITLRAEGVNFDEDFDKIFALNQALIGTDQSKLLVEVCIPDCPPVRDGPFIVDLIAGNDACPLPQLDTLTLMIEVEPPPNDFPLTATTSQTITRMEDSGIYMESIMATDSDGDLMTMSLIAQGGIEDPSIHGFGLNVTNSIAGSIESDFTWNTDCLLSDFSAFQNFRVGILIEDVDECLVPNPDTLFFDLRIILLTDQSPQVSSSIPIPDQVELGNSLHFDVTVSDSDNDDVSLWLVAGGIFDLDTYNIEFAPSSGNTSTSSSFSWDLACDADLYENGQKFELFFIGDDADKCKVTNFDTLKAVVQVNYPPNVGPEFEPIPQIQTLHVNETARIEIAAFDLDDFDEIILSFADGIRQPASETIRFEPVTGTGRVSSFLEWQPECDLLRFGETSTLQEVVFQVVDNACPINNIDTLKITFEIIDDSERQKEFLPPNVFTPNGDGVNDTFSLTGNLERTQNLPIDNCNNLFEYIVINNRAGNRVFRCENRDFVWSGGQFPSGVYYYFIKYSNTEFKGYIHLLR